MITQRAWLMGIIGFCFYLVTIVNNLPTYYYVLTWLTAGILGSSLAIAFLSLIGLRCLWSVPHEIVTENFSKNASGPVVVMEFSNEGTLNKTGIIIVVDLERSRDSAHLSRRFLLEALPSGDKISTALPLRHLPRGRYRITKVQLIGSDVLGLFTIRKTALSQPKESGSNTPIQNEIVVGPAALSSSSIATFSHPTAQGGEFSTPHTQGQDHDIRGTRFYAPGDDLRHVHWKTTARKGQLVVKEFHHTQQEQTLVIWDGALPVLPQQKKLSKTRSKKQESAPHLEAQEWSLRLTATICQMLFENRRPCALLRLDTAPVALGLDRNFYNDNLKSPQISSTLADAQAARAVSLSQAFEPFNARWTNGKICVVTTVFAPSPTELIARLHLDGNDVTVGLIAEDDSSGKYSSQVLALQNAGARVIVLAVSKDPQQFVLPITIAAQEILEITAPGVATSRLQPSL